MTQQFELAERLYADFGSESATNPPVEIYERDAPKVLKNIEGAHPQKVNAFESFEHLRGLVQLKDVRPERVSWFWQGYFPLGKLSIVDGDPGLGKSTLTIDLAARVSRGEAMPDGSPGVIGGVVHISCEDGLADTIVPRYEAAGADLSRIAALQGVPDGEGQLRPPTVEDTEDIRRACEAVGAKLLIIDPLMAHLDGTVNSYRDQDVRRALNPLALLAQELNIAVVLVRHLNKGAGQAIYRGGGSIGITGIVRTAYLVARDPEDENRRVLAKLKNNLAPEPPSISFCIEGVGDTSRIVWGGESHHRADSLLATPSDEDKPAQDEAVDFLLEVLSVGPVKAKDVQKESREAGIAEITLRRAKKTLGIRVEKAGFSGGWMWYLPEGAQNYRRCSSQNDEHLRGGMSTFEGNQTPEVPGGQEPLTAEEVLE